MRYEHKLKKSAQEGRTHYHGIQICLCFLCWLTIDVDVDVDVVDLRAQADASMPASNNNVSYTVYSNF